MDIQAQFRIPGRREDIFDPISLYNEEGTRIPIDELDPLKDHLRGLG